MDGEDAGDADDADEVARGEDGAEGNFLALGDLQVPVEEGGEEGGDCVLHG